MSILDHWHPVWEAKRLAAKPAGICLDGREMVLFRTPAGIAALDDCCPHRRMRLSLGSVVGERLQCQYHGWTFDCHGAGESPGTPKLRANVGCYEVREAYGWIWIRSRGADTRFPEFDVEGYEFIGTLKHEMDAPLEVVLDNFTEVEHTPTTHALLGYDLRRMTEVETQVDYTDSTVRVFNAGPQKKISAFIEFLFGIETGDRFVDDWTTRFSPVYSCYDQYWSDAKTGEPKGVRWRIYVFFNPIHAGRTQLVTFPFVQADPRGGWRNLFLFHPVLRRLVDREIKLDKTMVESLADKSPQIEGMKLSRFDKTLGLHRARINQIYRGLNEPTRVPADALS
jgi:vanillate O-demethylase monooxygenase subunit